VWHFYNTFMKTQMIYFLSNKTKYKKLENNVDILSCILYYGIIMHKIF